MSQKNVEVVRRFEELMIPSLESKDSARARGGFEEVLTLLDPDVVFVVASSIPHGGEWVGHEGFMKMCGTFRTAWNHIHPGHLEYVDAGGDQVIIVIDGVTFQSKETGKTVRHNMIELVTVRDGKITRFVPYYWDTALLVEAYGGVHVA
jgi:uncharacterized protein